MHSIEASFNGHSKSCCFWYPSGALPPQGICPGCSFEPVSLCLSLSLPSFKAFLICHLSEASPASVCLKLHFSCWLAFSVSLLCFLFLCPNYYLRTCCILYLLFIVCLLQMLYKFCEGKSFHLFCSMPFPTLRKYLLNAFSLSLLSQYFALRFFW